MIAIASLDPFERVTLGVHGKPLKPPEIVGVINGLRTKAEDLQARVDALMEENTKLRRDVETEQGAIRRLRDSLATARSNAASWGNE